VIDKPVLANEIALTLNHGTFTTQAVSRSRQAASMLREWKPHLIVVDVQLDEGLLLVDELPSMESDLGRIPVIGLTRSGDLERKLLAIDRGVDDILTLPFAPDELVARTFMVMRRAHRMEIALSPTIHVGELEIDLVNRRVRVGQSEIRLTSLEQRLLYLLAGSAGRVLSRDEILDALWGTEYDADSNIVD
jgi:DNA-binding response OmpR family regulator